MDTINAYILTLSGFSYKTVEQNICSLRAFFRFLFGEGIIRTDFALKMPMVKARKQTSIPSVWTKEELTKLIGAIDRASPKGKRDYAIILIACRLGLRCRDIKNLRLGDFHWAEKKLCLVQSAVDPSIYGEGPHSQAEETPGYAQPSPYHGKRAPGEGDPAPGYLGHHRPS